MTSTNYILGSVFSKATTALHRKLVATYCKYNVEISAAGKWDLSGSGIMPLLWQKRVKKCIDIDQVLPCVIKKKDPMQCYW